MFEVMDEKTEVKETLRRLIFQLDNAVTANDNGEIYLILDKAETSCRILKAKVYQAEKTRLKYEKEKLKAFEDNLKRW